MTIARVPLFERIESEVIDARKRRDETELSTLSLLKSEVVRASKEPGAIGIDDEQVRSGRADLDPIASNANAAGRARNRRVEIVLPRTDSVTEIASP